MRICDADGVETGHLRLSQEEGKSITLKQGKYTLNLLQGSGLGEYKLEIGVPRASADLGRRMLIKDSTSFKGQENWYTMTAPVSGLYRFRLCEAKNGFGVIAAIFDPLDKRLKSDYLSSDESIAVRLEAGETYRIRVEQSSDFGEYWLRIGCPKKMMDISGSEYVGDDVTYEDQENKYLLIVPKDGKYTIKLLKAEAGVVLHIVVDDHLGYEQMEKFFTIGQSETVSLKAGERYTVLVIQDAKYDSYTLQITP